MGYFWLCVAFNVRQQAPQGWPEVFMIGGLSSCIGENCFYLLLSDYLMMIGALRSVIRYSGLVIYSSFYGGLLLNLHYIPKGLPGNLNFNFLERSGIQFVKMLMVIWYWLNVGSSVWSRKWVNNGRSCHDPVQAWQQIGRRYLNELCKGGKCWDSLWIWKNMLIWKEKKKEIELGCYRIKTHICRRDNGNTSTYR